MTNISMRKAAVIPAPHVLACFLVGNIIAVQPACSQYTNLGLGNVVGASTNNQGINNRDGAANTPLLFPSDGTTTFGMPLGVSLGNNNASLNGAVTLGSDNVAGSSYGAGNEFAAVALGNNNRATGGYASSIGVGNLASGISTVALGTANTATGNTAIVVGRQSRALGDFSLALGNTAHADATNAIALGNAASATGLRSVAIGGGTGAAIHDATAAQAGGADSVALGTGAVTTAAANNSLAIGANAQASGLQSNAIGYLSAASGPQSSAIGFSNGATGLYASALGTINAATANFSYALGGSNTASNVGASAVGYANNATGNLSSAIGAGNLASGQLSGAFGYGNEVDGASSAALGNASAVFGARSFSVGTSNIIGSTTTDAVALGGNILLGADATGTDTASVTGAVALGANAGVTVPGGVALGQNSIANVAAGVAGYDPRTGLPSTMTTPAWVSTLAAVSVGNGTLATRQITGVAAGTGLTDAVNVAQLDAANQRVTGNATAIADLGASLAAGAIGPLQQSGLANRLTLVATAGTGAAPGVAQQIGNVAAGTVATDAVNLGQLAAVNAAINASGMNFTGNDAGAGLIHRDLGQELAIMGGATTTGTYSGANLKTVTAPVTGAIALQIADAPTFGTVTVNDGGTGRITGVTAGVTLTDAVNLGQLQQVAGVATNGVQYDDASRTSVTLNPGGQSTALRNVTAGTVAANSSDAVNGSQLFATNQQIAGNGAAIASLDGRVAGNTNAIADLGNQLAANTSSIGTLSASVAAGTIGLVQQTGGAPGAGAITIGAATGGTTATIAGTDGDRRLGGVAAGVAADDAANVGQLASAVTTATADAIRYDDPGRTSITLDAGGAPVRLRNVAAGTIDATSTDAVNGAQLDATNHQVAGNTTQIAALASGQAGSFRADNSGGAASPRASGADAVAGGFGAVASSARTTAIGTGASATGQNSVAIGYGSVDGGAANVVSVGAPGAERQIVNVTAGTRGTDAVNLAQLARGMGDTLSQANAYTDKAVASISFDLRAMGKRIDSGDARNAALAGIPQAIEAGQGLIGFGVGGTGGYTAVAIGASKAFADEHTIAKAGVSYAGYRNRVTWQVGVGYGF